MEAFGRSFLDEMKARFEIDLAGVTTIESARSPELEKRVHPLLPTARSVVVFAKEIYSEVVDLLRPSNEAGEAHGGGPPTRAFGVPKRKAQQGSA